MTSSEVDFSKGPIKLELRAGDKTEFYPSDELLRAQNQLLRKALIGMVGAETKEELLAMESFLQSVPASDPNIVAAINAIQALLQTINER